MGQNVKKIIVWGYFRGLEGVFNYQTYLAFQLSSHPYICIYEIGKQSDKKFLSLTPKYEKKKKN